MECETVVKKPTERKKKKMTTNKNNNVINSMLSIVFAGVFNSGLLSDNFLNNNNHTQSLLQTNIDRKDITFILQFQY